MVPEDYYRYFIIKLIIKLQDNKKILQIYNCRFGRFDEFLYHKFIFIDLYI